MPITPQKTPISEEQCEDQCEKGKKLQEASSGDYC